MGISVKFDRFPSVYRHFQCSNRNSSNGLAILKRVEVILPEPRDSSRLAARVARSGTLRSPAMACARQPPQAGVLNRSSDQCGCERSHRYHAWGYSHKLPENRAGRIKRWELLYLEIQILSNEINSLVIFQGRLSKVYVFFPDAALA